MFILSLFSCPYLLLIVSSSLQPIIPATCLLICLFIQLLVYLSVNQLVHLRLCLATCSFSQLFVQCHPVHLTAYSSIRLSVCSSVDPASRPSSFILHSSPYTSIQSLNPYSHPFPACLSSRLPVCPPTNLAIF